MDANSLSPDQLRALADQKEQEAKVRKIGFLRHDLYDFPSVVGYSGLHYHRGDIQFPLTPAERDDAIKKFTRGFKMILPRGLRMNCYLIDGEEVWSDDDGNLEIINDARWVEKHLERVEEV